MVLAEKLKRPSALAVAALLLLASLVPVLVQRKASAYGLLTAREIRMSSSVTGASTAGQDVTYLVRATTPLTATIGSIAIEFCSNSPIIGDSCTAPAGMDINEAGLAIANQTGITTWTATADASSTANIVVLTRTAASFTAGTFTFEMGAGGASDGITNPTTTNTTFYARILTFLDEDDDANGCSGVDDSAVCYPTTAISGNSTDAGGIAMSTAAQITVTAKVQERLTFCVYTSAVNFTDCAAVSGTAVTLGDTNGVLADTGPFVDINTKYNVSTNASSGVSIRAKGATLTSGAFTINGMGDTANTSTTGSEEFGFCTYRDTGGGAAGLTPVAPYDTGDAGVTCDAQTSQTAGTGGTGGAGTATFAFDTTTACGVTAANADFGENNLGCRYGDVIATKTAGSQSTGVIAFIGNIATTTEPGIYTSTLTFIATGIY